MSNQNEVMEEEFEGMKIPYYSRRFQNILRILEKYNGTANDQTVQWQAQWQALKDGIRYYYQVIQKEQRKNVQRDLCNSLVEAMNRAVYCLGDARNILLMACKDEEGENVSDVDTWLSSYREYLQWICNIFMKEIESSQRLIIEISLDLLKNKVAMYTLFSQIHGYEVKKDTPSLCIVFCPSNDQLQRVYKYLPMLTHEISHHFRYIDQKKRNEFLLKYLLDQLCVLIVESMFQMVSEKGSHIVYGGAEAMLVSAMSDELKTCFENEYPNFLENGHLVQMKDCLYQFFYDMVRKDESAEKIYKNGEPVFLVLKEAFCGLAFMTDMSWYVINPKEKRYSGEEILLSMVLDLLSFSDDNSSCDKEWTSVVCMDERYQHMINCLIEENKGEDVKTVTNEAIRAALDFLVLKVGEALNHKFSSESETMKLKEKRREVFSSWFYDYCEFENKIEQFRKLMTRESEQEFYSFFDMCVSVKNYIDNVLYICSMDKSLFQRKKTTYPILKKVLDVLKTKIREELNRGEGEPTLEKAYLSNRMIHAEIVKMGLLDERENVFVSLFLKLFSDWDMDLFNGLIGEYMKIYEEVFADLGMCAAFGFNRIGYFNYIIEKFSYEREPENHIGQSKTIERLRLVLSVLNEPENYEDFVKIISGIELKDTEARWKEEIALRLKKKREEENDVHFKKVFDDYIVNSNWVKACRDNEIIQAVGQYYNSSNENKENKKEMEKLFFECFTAKTERRGQMFEAAKRMKQYRSPIDIMLTEVDENAMA